MPLWLLVLPFLSCALLAQDNSSKEAPALTFREPFTLKLRVDKDHYYEQHFDKVPYVAENDIYLFLGDHFGINLTDNKGEFLTIAYQPDIAKADVQFGFTQEKAGDGIFMMMLTVQNKTDRRLSYEALMTVPKREGILKTSVVPIEPRLSSFESWPHPIVQLVLRNFRFSDSPAKRKGTVSSDQK
ncbi:MAG TPA: hypothetical protein VLT90_15125 [Terriglobales bacterium]|nr:hypothetical protein [Terriglobales bacterium]